MYSQDKLRAFYDQDVKRRAALDVHPWKQIERGRFLEEIKENKAKTLLELGAGTGKDSLFFMGQCLEVTAVDLSEGMVNHCKEKGVDARQMDFMKLEFPDKSFDAIYALNSLLHTPKKDLPNVLKGIWRIMKPNALFYMGVYGGKDFEGILEEDTFEPKRFFAYYKTEDMLERVMALFDLRYFRQVNLKSGYEFHSMMLSKTCKDT